MDISFNGSDIEEIDTIINDIASLRVGGDVVISDGDLDYDSWSSDNYSD